MCAHCAVRARRFLLRLFDVAIDARKFAEVLDSLCAAGLSFEPRDTLDSLCDKTEHVAALLSPGSPELTVTLADPFSLQWSGPRTSDSARVQ